MIQKTMPVRIDKLLYKKLREFAKADGRSITWLMHQAVIQYLGREKRP